MKISIFISGIVFLIQGVFVVFSEKYFRFMTKKFLGKGDADKKLFSGENGYWYDKITRGIKPLITSLILLIFSIFIF